MKRRLFLIFIALFFSGIFSNISAQKKENKAKIIEQTNVKYLNNFSRKKAKAYKNNKALALKVAKEKGWIISREIEDGAYMELQGITEDGRPLYYTTYNNHLQILFLQGIIILTK